MNMVVSLLVLGALAVVGAVRAGQKSVTADSSGRRAELWVLAALLGLTAMVGLAGAWWFWRFWVEFDF
ncbi:MAG: hypothetical protein ACRD1D_16255 [Acidimicrobiales bacterium]